MIVAAALFTYAALLAVLPSRLLTRAAWPMQAPRWGILTWQALSVSWLLALTGAGIALVVPTAHLSTSLSELLETCARLLREHYSSPSGAAIIGVLVAVLVPTVAVVGVAREMLIAGAARRRHRLGLRVAGRRWPQAEGSSLNLPLAVVVDHRDKVAYCLPGRGGRIVLSSAALAALEPAELDAVVAHERAHLDGRHHLLLASSAGLARMFRGVPLLAAARAATAQLIEMLADDRAARAGEPLTVAAALLALAGPRARDTAQPVAALAATATGTAVRVRRLLGPPPTLRARSRLLAAAAATVLIAVPLTVLAVPAVAIANSLYCPA